MSSLKRFALVVAAIAIGCSTRALEPHHDAGVINGPGADGDVDRGGDTSVVVDTGPDKIIVDPPGRFCGDGKLDPGEQCDDGNRTPGDGCTALCQIPCSSLCGSCGEPTPCITVHGVCGDRLLGSSEICDDGNLTGGDGCAADCGMIEPGWTCPIPGRRCVPF